MRKILSLKVQQTLAWLLKTSAIIRLKQRFPRFVAFVIARFDPVSFSGLPLTIFCLVFGFNALLLSELTESVVESEWVVVFDQKVSDLLFSVRNQALSEIFYTITQLGTRAAVLIIGGIITLFLLLKKRYLTIVSFWLVIIGAGLSVDYGKTFFSRTRPIGIAFYPEHNFSFPSGHTTTATTLFGLCAYLAFIHVKNFNYRNIIIGLALLIIVLVGISRIYLGVHYLSDVIAGLLLGVMWLLLGVSLTEMLLQQKQRKSNNLPGHLK